jgi:hypothetical protein
MNKRTCPHCHCSKVVKHGKQSSRQRYFCKTCRISFTTKPKPSRRNELIQQDFINDKLSARLLSEKYSLHPNTIRKIVKKIKPKPIIQIPRKVSVIMDVTYWKRQEGLLVVIDPNALRHENLVLYYCFINHTETTLEYTVAIDTVLAMGYDVISATIDGRRGVKEMLEDKSILVQYCQFHQLQTMNQCLTRNPVLPQHRELRSITLTLTRTDQETFSSRLANWHLKYGVWLRERYIDEEGRNRYRHERCRRIYFSLMRNLPNLFTYQQDGTNKTRNTTSPLDGQFAVWKDKLKAHRGITPELKDSLLRNFFSGATGNKNN